MRVEPPGMGLCPDEGTPESSVTLPSRELAVQGQLSGKLALTRQQCRQHPDLGHAASGAVSNACLLLVSRQPTVRF